MSKMFDEKELMYLEGVINEEIVSCLRSGEDVDGEYIVTLRGVLKKLGLKEYYRFDEWRDE